MTPISYDDADSNFNGTSLAAEHLCALTLDSKYLSVQLRDSRS